VLTTTSEALAAPTPKMERTATLRAETMPIHEKLDGRIMQHRPFGDIVRYAAFVRGQLALQQRMETMYADPRLLALIPDLAERSRLASARQDIADIGADTSITAACTPLDTYTVGEALGWLYVSEGSNLGAAFLLKEAQKLGFGPENGARHLAPHPEGRGLQWRRFGESLNTAPLSEDDEQDVVPGARAAFQFVWDAFETEFARL
jgi:heme oxygenase (biliverdin-IX-beta and delta-forming)